MSVAVLGSRPAASAQTTQPTRAIVGTVTSDSAGVHGIGNVEILIPALGRSTRTNWMGEYRIAGVAAGAYPVTARLVGYRSMTDTARVGDADARIDFVLDQRAVALDSVVTRATTRHYISGNLNGFEERMNAHMGGSFLGDSVLRANENLQLPDVMRSRVPAADFVTTGPGSQTYVYSNRAGGQPRQCPVFIGCARNQEGPSIPGPPRPDLCYAAVFVDGVPIYDPAKMHNVPPPDLNNSYAVSNLGGVEYYPDAASVPAQFRSVSAECGVLVLWTREK